MAASLSAEQARAAWLQHLAHERRASPRTLEAYGFAAARYIAFLERHRGEALTVTGLAEVTAGEVRAWLAHLRAGDHPLSPRSLARRCRPSAPSTVFSTAGLTRRTPRSPWSAGRA